DDRFQLTDVYRHGRGGTAGRLLDDGAADSFGLEESPLITGLGLLLCGQGSMILGLDHLAGGQPGQDGRNQSEKDRGDRNDSFKRTPGLGAGGRRNKLLGGKGHWTDR